MKKGALITVGYSITNSDWERYRTNIDTLMGDYQKKAATMLGKEIFFNIGACISKGVKRKDIAEAYEATYVVIRHEHFKDLMKKLDGMGMHEASSMLGEIIK